MSSYSLKIVFKGDLAVLFDLKELWPLTLWETQVKVATSPARMELGPDRLTALVGSEDTEWVVMASSLNRHCQAQVQAHVPPKKHCPRKSLVELTLRYCVASKVLQSIRKIGLFRNRRRYGLTV